MNKEKLLEKLKTLLSDIDDSMEDDIKAAMVRTFWNIGYLALQYQAHTGMTIQQIASEIDANKTSLQRYTQFFKTYPKGYPEKYHNKVINWSMFYIVMSVHDKKAREFYLKEACRLGWDKYEFIRRIKENYFFENNLAVDAQKNQGLKDKRQKLYTYKAEVLKVVDGDTLDLIIDVGFKLTQEHRVRLRGINAPELSTDNGQKSKDFISEELSKCVIEKSIFQGGKANYPLVVVKTYKRGLYGRYIADIYYLPGENKADVIAEKGKLLNQVLIDKGLAIKVE